MDCRDYLDPSFSACFRSLASARAAASFSLDEDTFVIFLPELLKEKHDAVQACGL